VQTKVSDPISFSSSGVGPSSKAMIFVITCPVGPYYKTGFAAVSLSATSHYVRAWPGGTGDAKVGGNYAPGIRPQIEVGKQGYQQNLWLFGPNDNLTEGNKIKTKRTSLSAILSSFVWLLRSLTDF
jgi:branched-subunit amino acid aminotransferase/4-amino-4-deoxychorismate lyase